MISAEFLFCVLINLAIVMLFSSMLIKSMDDFRQTVNNIFYDKELHETARMLELSLINGIAMETDYEFTIKGNLIIKTGEGMIETQGVFILDRDEPL